MFSAEQCCSEPSGTLSTPSFRYVSKSQRCSMCAAHNDVPAECRSGSMSHGAGGLFLLLLLVLCVGCFCMQQQQQYEARSFNGEPAVGYPAPPGYQGYPGQPVYGQPAMPMYSQPMYGGGLGGPGVGMASGAAAGFVGGMAAEKAEEGREAAVCCVYSRRAL